MFNALSLGGFKPPSERINSEKDSCERSDPNWSLYKKGCLEKHKATAAGGMGSSHGRDTAVLQDQRCENVCEGHSVRKANSKTNEDG